VTQLALLLVLGLLGSLLAFVFGRLELRRGPVAATVKRAEGALERASLSLLRPAALRALGLLAVPAIGLAVFAWQLAGPHRISSGGRVAFMVLALVTGAVATLAHARLSLSFGARAASAAAAARARGSARTLRPLLRAAVAVAVCGEGVGLLGVAALFAGLYAVRGGFASAQPSAELAGDIAQLLPAFALGAGVAALSLSREGSIAGAAARLGGARHVEPTAGLDGSDARDPALLAQLVGYVVGELLPRVLLSFLCGVVATIAVVLLAALGGASGSLQSLVMVVLVRTFGAVASVCGVLAARVTDDEPAARALVRGHSSAFFIALFGLGAALFWLMREQWGALFVAGAAGLASTTFVAIGAGLSAGRSVLPAADARATTDAGLIARGLGSGFTSAWPSLLVPTIALTAVEQGLSAEAAPGALLVSFVAGALSLGPFAASLDGFGVLAQQVRGVVALSRLEQEADARGVKLDDASALGRAAGGTYVSIALGAALLLGLAAVGGRGSPSSSGGIGWGSLAIALGLALLTLLGAGAARSAVSGARVVAAEVERQRRASPEGAPSYKACVDAALAVARAVSPLELAAVLACPFALAGLLRVGGVSPGDAHFPSFGFAAVAAGLIFTLGGRATRARLGDQRPRPRGTEAPTSTQAEAFGDLVGVPVAASVEALALVLALTVLCLAPLLR
jgi:hypothetical protein